MLTAFSQSTTIQELKDSNTVQFGLYFYPSTLRMLNFQKDTAFDKMIQGVERLNVYLLDPKKFEQTDFYDLTDKLINQENYEEYIIWEGDAYQLQVLGKAKKKELVGLANYADAFYVFDMKGTIDLLQLPDFYNAVTSQDSTKKSGFSYIYNMIKDREESRKRREKWEIEREERRRKKEEEKKHRQDSLAKEGISVKIEEN
jgi:uncharacterized protein YfkK (UPF0435 family)